MPISAIKVVSIIASMPGLERVLREVPGLEVFVGAADASLDKRCALDLGFAQISAVSSFLALAMPEIASTTRPRRSPALCTSLTLHFVVVCSDRSAPQFRHSYFAL